MSSHLFGTNSQNTSVSLLILPTHLLISPSIHLHSPLVYTPLTIEDRTLQAILSRFHSCATSRPPSPPIATIAPCCLLCLTIPDFDLAPRRNENSAIADLIWYSADK